VLGMALSGWIIVKRAFQLIFGGVEFKRRIVNFDGDSGELDLAVRIGSSLEIKVMKPTKAVCDVDLHGRVINGLSVRA
jgi:hypothetical protein